MSRCHANATGWLEKLISRVVIGHLQPRGRCCIVAVELGVADVASDHLFGLVAGLLHDAALGGAADGGGGRKAGAQ